MNTEALCTACLCRMGRTSETLRAGLVRWLMDYDGYTGQERLTDQQVVTSPDPLLINYLVDASAIMALFIAEARRRTPGEPPF